MRHRRAGAVLLLVQLVLVLSVAGKYLYERKVCPRVWVRSAQFDPEQPLRGRYLALSLLVDGCSLPRDQAHYTQGYQDANGKLTAGYWAWQVTLGASNGRLTPQLGRTPMHPEDAHEVTLYEGKLCDRAPVNPFEEYFIPEHAKGPLPLKPGEELWVEVTVPPTGPPRPIQLAVSGEAGFRPLKFD